MNDEVLNILKLDRFLNHFTIKRQKNCLNMMLLEKLLNFVRMFSFFRFPSKPNKIF